MKDISNELKPVLTKMCEYVNANPEEIEWRNEEDPYFWKYEWTQKQEQDFINWLADYLYNNKEARNAIMEYPRKNKKICRRVAEFFVWNYGWKEFSSNSNHTSGEEVKIC